MDAKGGVFEDEAFFWIYAHFFCGVEEDLGVRLTVGHVALGDYMVEEIEGVDCLECFMDNILRTTGGDACGVGLAEFAGEFYDAVDGFCLMRMLIAKYLNISNHGLGIEGMVVNVVEMKNGLGEAHASIRAE